jgi:F0F1-type ATP synthase assembly protein I
MSIRDNRVAARAIFAQFGLALVVAAAFLPWGWVRAYSALIGGAAAASAGLLFAVGVFGRYRAQEAGALAGRMVAAELAKLAYTGSVFVVAFLAVRPLSPVALQLAYLAVQLAPAVAAAMDERQPKNERAGSWPRKP